MPHLAKDQLPRCRHIQAPSAQKSRASLACGPYSGNAWAYSTDPYPNPSKRGTAESLPSWKTVFLPPRVFCTFSHYFGSRKFGTPSLPQGAETLSSYQNKHPHVSEMYPQRIWRAVIPRLEGTRSTFLGSHAAYFRGPTSAFPGYPQQSSGARL